MARDHYWNAPCAVQTCTERERLIFGTHRELARHERHRCSEPYKCTRHRHPEDVISNDDPTRDLVYTVIADRSGGHRFGALHGGSRTQLGGGFEGYIAFASDFSIGTRVRITVTVEQDSEDDGRQGNLGTG